MGIPQVSGLKVWFNPDADKGQRIKRVELQGEELNPDKPYLVAHTDVEIFRYGCIHLMDGQTSRFEMPTILNEVMLEALQLQEPVKSPPGGRWIKITR